MQRSAFLLKIPLKTSLALDGCHKRFNKECTKNAYCDETNVDYPECVCHEGFHGDGRRFCDPNSDTITTTQQSTSTITARQRIMISNGKEASNETPFLIHNWNHVESAATSPIASSPTSVQITHVKSKDPKETIVVNKDLTEIDKNSKADSVQEDISERMLLYIILPSIFMAIWLVLIIAIVIICCRRKRLHRSTKYSPQMMGWSPRDYTSTRNSYFSQTTFT